MKGTWIVVGNYITFFATLVALGVPWNNTTLSGALNAIPTPITLAPLAYMFWGFVCVCVVFSLVWQTAYHDSKEVSKMSFWFMICSVLQVFSLSPVLISKGAWAVSICYNQTLTSTVLIVVLFLSLANLNGRMAEGSTWVRFPFSLWYGWVTYLVLQTFTIWFLNDSNLRFFSTWIWALEVIVAMAGLAVFWTIFDNIIGFPMAMGWCLLGLYFADYSIEVRLASLTAYILVMVSITVRLMVESVKSKRQLMQREQVPLLPTFQSPESPIPPTGIPPQSYMPQTVYYYPFPHPPPLQSTQTSSVYPFLTVPTGTSINKY